MPASFLLVINVNQASSEVQELKKKISQIYGPKIFTSKNFFCLLQTRKFWLDPKLPLISNSYILTKEWNCLSNLIASWKNIQNFHKKLHCQLCKREGFLFHGIFTRYFDRNCWFGQYKSHFLRETIAFFGKNC